MELIRSFKRLGKGDAAIAGGKGASLGEMTQAGIPVPPGFVLLANAFEQFITKADLSQELDAILDNVNREEIATVDQASEKIKSLILAAHMPDDIAQEVEKNFKELDADFVAVRSSATAEDGATAAWAGQLETYLNTTEEDLLENVKRCWASLFTPRAIFYRFEKGMHGQKISVAVVVQKMIQSEVSGIAFSVHPVTEDYNQLIIEAGFGLGEAIVSGQVTPDSYVVEKEPRRIIDINITTQTRALGRGKNGGNEWRDLTEEEGSKPALSKEQVMELTEIVLHIEKHYGFPCDIEWAFEAGQFFITQSRPITTLKPKKADGEPAPQQPVQEKANVPVPFDGKDEWMLAENIPDSDIFFFQIPFSCFAEQTSYPFIQKYKEVLCDYHKFEMDFYFGKRDSFEVAESIMTALIEREDFGGEINEKIIEWSQKLLDTAEAIGRSPLAQASEEELWRHYEKHDHVHTKLYTYGWLPVSVDMFHNNFTENLKKYLRTVCTSDEDVEISFQILTTPSKKTILAQEREEFLRIYDKYHENLRQLSAEEAKASTELTEDLEAYSKKWGHLGYIYAGNAEVFGPDHYLNEMLDLVKSDITAKSILDKEEQQLKAAEANKKKTYQRLEISQLYKRLFNTAVDFSLTKLVRRNAQLRTLYVLHHTLLDEIAKRLKLSRQQVQFMYKEEVRDALRGDTIDPAELTARLDNCVIYIRENAKHIYRGAQAEALRSGLKKDVDTTLTEFKGQTAQPGYAKGAVKIIIRAKDMGKMNRGDILVSIATDPDVVPAMKKAAAIVTEQGGITSHAAIVSREMGTPCIIGTKIATKILKDGDIVEVDATKGIVRILERA